jgi:hypothetical protein
MISEFGLAGAWEMVWKGRATHIHTLWFSLSVLAFFTIGPGTLVHKTKSSLKFIAVSVFLSCKCSEVAALGNVWWCCDQQRLQHLQHCSHGSADLRLVVDQLSKSFTCSTSRLSVQAGVIADQIRLLHRDHWRSNVSSFDANHNDSTLIFRRV